MMKAVFAALAALTISAHAEEATKFSVDMTAKLSDWDGKPIRDAFQQTGDDPACAKCDDLTLGEAVSHSLVLVLQADRDMDGTQRWAWQELARRVHKEKAAQLTAKEQSIIGDRLLKVYAGIPMGSVVIGAAMPMIDPNRKPELK